MLLTISTGSEVGAPAPAGPAPAGPAPTDLGFVLHKHPDNVRTISTTGGQVSVFWPRADAGAATVATLVDIDPVGLVRRGRAKPLAAYVNDRAYVASSLLSVAIGRLFRSAMNGDCPSRPELVDHRWPVTAHLPVVPVGGDRQLVNRLFEPLGYEVTVDVPLLDETIPAWGSAPVGGLILHGRQTMRDLLRHLYVLLPVLDDDKHYWIDESEVAKLLRHGDGWLTEHPEQELITRRYLSNLHHLTSKALPRRSAEVDESEIERPISLNQQRLAAVVEAVLAAGPSSVVDLGCGEGNLLVPLAERPSLARLVGVDVTIPELRRAETRLKLDRRPERQRPAVELRHSSLTYRDPELAGFDVACLVEVIEHLDPDRVEVMERILFGHNQPGTVIVTTPNRDYNPLFDLADGQLRHRDHRFEWTRDEFAAWARRVSDLYGYRAEHRPIGPEDPIHGPPTQMAIFSRSADGDEGS